MIRWMFQTILRAMILSPCDRCLRDSLRLLVIVETRPNASAMVTSSSPVPRKRGARARARRERFEFPPASFLVYVRPGASATAQSAMTLASKRRMRSTLASLRSAPCTYNVYVSHVHLSWIPRIDRGRRGHAWSRDSLRESVAHRTHARTHARRADGRCPTCTRKRKSGESPPLPRRRRRCRGPGVVVVVIVVDHERRGTVARRKVPSPPLVNELLRGKRETPGRVAPTRDATRTGKRGVQKWSPPSATGLLFSFGARIPWVSVTRRSLSFFFSTLSNRLGVSLEIESCEANGRRIGCAPKRHGEHVRVSSRRPDVAVAASPVRVAALWSPLFLVYRKLAARRRRRRRRSRGRISRFVRGHVRRPYGYGPLLVAGGFETEDPRGSRRACSTAWTFGGNVVGSPKHRFAACWIPNDFDWSGRIIKFH